MTKAPDPPTIPLEWENIVAIPVVHGRIAFALDIRRRLLSERFDAVAIELPQSLESAVHEGIDLLPKVSVVLYRTTPAFLDTGTPHLWYVPIDPCDAMIESMRIARGERTTVHFVDAETDEFRARPMILPDAHAILGLGLERWYHAVLPEVRTQNRTDQDFLRERHMAARLSSLSQRLGPKRRILFVTGIAHWEHIRRHLELGSGKLHEDAGPDRSLVRVEPVQPRSLPHVLGEPPFLTHHYEEHRKSLSDSEFQPTEALKSLVLTARENYEKEASDSLERATPRALRNLLEYTRKLTVSAKRLFPSTYTLGVAAKGTIGNDFAVHLLRAAHDYPPNNDLDPGNGVVMTETRGIVEGEPTDMTTRAPGEARSFGELRLRHRPPRESQEKWRRHWNPHTHCSWPPEDVILENFRDYVAKRALGMAGLALHRTEPFTSSFKDGIALRETLRDWHQNRIHVKEEPRVAGSVSALVIIFEEDDDGTRFPWRQTWHAEHEWESTLAFYATNPLQDLVGPGIGRMTYGGCMFLFPPMGIPDVWEDLRLERARRPSERLLLAALAWSRERFVVHVGKAPPSPAVNDQAAILGRHVVHLPLTSFSPSTLERLRRAHVLNGREVRGWARDFL